MSKYHDNTCALIAKWDAATQMWVWRECDCSYWDYVANFWNDDNV